jgi:hypothetical protein
MGEYARLKMAGGHMLNAGGQLGNSTTASTASSHKDLLAMVNLSFFSDHNDLAIKFKDGRYVLLAEYREYPLPLKSSEGRHLILECVPNISEKTLNLLVAILSLRHWTL